MRKLRDDITLVEYRATMEKKGYVVHPLIRQLTGAPGTPPVGVDWPDSFYEQPPVGSFGKFVACTGSERWGFRGRTSTTSDGVTLYHDRDNDGYVTRIFLPGLPQDVDEFGMPLEKNDE